MSRDIVRVALEDRSYDVVIGRDLAPDFREWLGSRRPSGGVFVVTDRNVASIYGGDVSRWLGDVPFRTCALPPGEENKSWDTVRGIYTFLAGGVPPGSGPGTSPGIGADRDSLVVAFGGGVVGDLAGFAAASYLRGLSYVQIPTTLLAQIDSSVGGKTGFNLAEGKNLVGAFHQPLAVFIDRAFLLTLDERNLRAGLAEAVKCALAGDEALWELFLSHGGKWSAMPDRDWLSVIRRSVAFKAGVVARDERESSRRRILNLGHTAGHALERAAGYGGLLHGEAVAMGLAWEAVFGARLGITPADLPGRICRLLQDMGFALDDPRAETGAVAAALGADKKRVAADIEIPLVTAPGRCVLKRVAVAALARELPWIRDEVRRHARHEAPSPPETAAAAQTVPERAEAETLARIGRGEGREVVAELEQRVSGDPTDTGTIRLLAEAYRRTGNLPGAWETIKEALQRRPSDLRAQRIAREIEAEIGAAPPGDAARAPLLEDIVVTDEGTFALRAADGPTAPEREGTVPRKPKAPAGELPRAAGPPPAPGKAPAGGPPPLPPVAPQGPPATPGPPVRTVTMADVYRSQGRNEEARAIVAEILRENPGDARALAWMKEHGGEAGSSERELTALLESILKEYGHELSRPL